MQAYAMGFVITGLLLMGAAVTTVDASEPAHESIPVWLGGVAVTHTLLPDGRTLRIGGIGVPAHPDARLVAPDGETNVVQLAMPRTDATATVLPNGKVLIWGGLDASKNLVDQGEWFDPASSQTSVAKNISLLPRAGHTATLLTDGRLLITGGWNPKLGPLTEAELWDYRTNTDKLLATDLVPARSGHSATLLADGRVLILGGYDAHGHRFTDGALFDPARIVFVNVDSATAKQLQVPSANTTVAQSIPKNQETNFPYDGLIALRFSVPLAITSLNTASVTLLGPAGPTAIHVVPAEAGRLLFVQPTDDLLPNTTYTLFVSGAQRPDGIVLPFTSLSFTTSSTVERTTTSSASPSTPTSSDASTAPAHAPRQTIPLPMVSISGTKPIRTLIAGTAKAQAELQANCGNTQRIHGYQFCHRNGSVADGIFTPGFSDTDEHWQVGKPAPKTLVASELPQGAIAPGTTGLFGTVRRIDDKPLSGATVSIGDIQATTDAAGHFVLKSIPAGHQVLLVDGSTANRNGEKYGEFYAAVTIKEKRANAVPFNLYVPRITARDEVAIPAPTTDETVISHLAIPGLEIHIPAGTVLRDRHGKILTHLAVVPMPSDRSPVPLPGNFPVYFSVQPATAIVQSTTAGASKGVQLIYPNYVRFARGRQHTFWIYDANRGGWLVYTSGHVSRDGTKVQPNSDLGLNMPMPAGYNVGGPQPPDPTKSPPPGGCGGGFGGGSGGGGDPPLGDFGGGPPSNGPAGAGAPVDCFTGMFSYRSEDFHIRDVMPIDLTRVYSTAWNTAWTPDFIFGRGVMHNYAMYLYSPTANQTAPAEIDLVLSNGSVIPFSFVSGGLDNGGPGLWVSYAYPREFYGARLTNDESDHQDINKCGVCITLSNGTVMRFPDSGTATSPSWLQWIKDRNGNKVTLGYSGNQLTSISSPSGRKLTFTYTGNLVTSVSDSLRTISYAYSQDPLNPGVDDLLHTVTYPDGTTEQYSYDSSDRLQTVTDRRGNVVITNQYDTSDRVIQQTLGDSAVYHWGYHSGYTDVTDPRGYVRHITFDSQGYPLTVTRAFGTGVAQTTTFVRGQDELVTLKTDPLGRKTRSIFDPNGNLLLNTYLANTPSAISYAYTYTSDGFNQVQSVTDPLGHTTTYSYANGCLIAVTDALGHTTTIACNSAGQPTAVTDTNGNSTIYGYDGFDLHTVTNALGNTTTYTTDTLGRVTAIQDPLGNVSQIQYDVSGTTRYGVNDPPLRIIDPMGQSTSYEYDNDVNLISVTDPNGGETQYGYDVRNRKNSRTDALQQTETWNYDGSGNLLNHTDRNHQETTYLYDPLNRPSLVTYADGSTVTPTFDAGNRLTQVVDTVSGTITRSYDSLDRLTQEQTPQGTVGYTYDAASRRQSMSPAAQSTVQYQFDAGNRLTQISQGTETVQFGYDSGNRRVTVGLPNGVLEAYSYDAANEMVGISYSNETGVLGELQYTYDAAGRRIGRTGGFATPPPPTLFPGANYDLNNTELASGTYTLPLGWGSTGNDVFSYDDNGNLSESQVAGNTHSQIYYEWDARNRLQEIDSGNYFPPHIIGAYTYDTFGRRTSKTIGGTTTTFLYDGANPVQETNGSTIQTILTGLGIDERYARDDAAYGRTYFLTDALGSTLALTDATGTVQQTYAYEPYGQVTATGSSDNPYQYTGRENDGTGLYYDRARYYSPTMKRFISADPVGLGGGINQYVYADDSPTNLIDLSGTSSVNGKNAQSSHSWKRAPGPGGNYPGPERPSPGGSNNSGSNTSGFDLNFDQWQDAGCAKIQCYPQCTANGPNAPYTLLTVGPPGSTLLPLPMVPSGCECLDVRFPLQTTEPTADPNDWLEAVKRIQEGESLEVE